MKFTQKIGQALLYALLAVGSSLQASDFLIHDGDRVVFLGDSITEQKLYTTYIEAYTLTRFPTWNLSFRNVGWGGDTSWLRQRGGTDEGKLFAADDATQQKMIHESVGNGLQRDVLPLRPTVVTIKFGMNDHSYQAFREDIFRAYCKSETELGQVLKANGARIAYLTPQPIESRRADPDKEVNNISLRKFSDGLKDVAAKENAVFVDQFAPYMSIMLEARKGNPNAMIGAGDSVHPGPCGHTIMAWAVLKGLAADAAVSRAGIDAANKKLTTAQGCKIDGLNFDGGKIQFSRLDDALPMPIDDRAEGALKLAPILNELSRYELCVSGLTQGNYELFIDGESVLKTTAEELGRGVNLTMTGGAITKQAREVLAHVFAKNEIFFNRWRNVQLYNFPHWANGANAEEQRKMELARLDKQIADEEALINKLRKPTVHQFELKPF